MDNNQHKDLGLIDILQIFGQWIVTLVKKLIDWTLFLIFFGIKRWLIFAIIIGATIIFSFISFKTQESQYEANMIVRCNAVEAIQMKKYFDAYSNILNNKLLEDDYITKITGLDRTYRSRLSSIHVYCCIDKNKDDIIDNIDYAGKAKSSDEDLDSLHLNIKVGFNDISVLPQLQSNIIEYIEGIPYIIKNNKTRLVDLDNRKSFLLKEIDLMDSLQMKSSGGINPNRSARMGGVFIDNREVLIYEDKLILLDMIEDVQKDIDLYRQPITIIEDFVVGKSAINTLSGILKKNIGLAFVGTYLILMLLFVYKKEKVKYLK